MKLKLIYFCGLALMLSGLILQSQVTLASQSTPEVAVQTQIQTVAQENEKGKEKSYLEKLFGSFGSSQKNPTQLEMSLTDWIIAIPATLFYGQVALLAILWILFSSSWVGAITGLIVVGLCLAFTVPKQPRPIGLFVLAAINFLLALGITFNVAFQEGVPLVLLSLLPLGWLVWWTFGQAFLKKKL